VISDIERIETNYHLAAHLRLKAANSGSSYRGIVTAGSQVRSIETNSRLENLYLPIPLLNMPTNIEIELLRQNDMLRGAVIFAMDKMRSWLSFPSRQPAGQPVFAGS
jgi:hypothetical protein